MICCPAKYLDKSETLGFLAYLDALVKQKTFYYKIFFSSNPGEPCVGLFSLVNLLFLFHGFQRKMVKQRRSFSLPVFFSLGGGGFQNAKIT